MLFEWLFSRVLSSHCGGPGSIPGRDMSVLGSLVEDEDDLGQVYSFFKIKFFSSILGPGSARVWGEGTGRANRGVDASQVHQLKDGLWRHD